MYDAYIEEYNKSTISIIIEDENGDIYDRVIMENRGSAGIWVIESLKSKYPNIEFSDNTLETILDHIDQKQYTD